ncbi:MAG: hypothetical protein PHH08_03825 [Candidatus ainarchaeum sp.]|nr:hypothetical protein [Candidatus ainarchaeum sp.]
MQGRNKILFFGFCIFFSALVLSAGAISINAAKNIEKGGRLEITGTGLPGKVAIKIFSEDWLIKEKEVFTDSNGFFVADYNIGFTDPSGNWRAVASQNQDRDTANFTVAHSNESAFLFIKFFSPSKQSFLATEKVSFNVKITDSGKNVERAVVYAWFPMVEKTLLAETESGIYSGELAIPPVLQPGDYNVFVTSEKVISSWDRRGGEGIMNVTVARPEIIIRIIKPALYESSIGETIEILAVPEYSTGAKPAETEMVAEIKGRKIAFEKTAEGFLASYAPDEGDVGLLKVKISGYDSFGNSGQEEISLKITGLEKSFWQKNLWLIITAVAVVCACCFAVLWFFKKRTKENAFAKKKREIETKMKKVEESFYKRPTVDRKTFDDVLAKYREELDDLKGKD